MGRQTELHFVKDGVKVNARNFKTTILKPGLKDLTQELFDGEDWVFMQDSAPAHKAKTTQEWLEGHVPSFITAREWPPYSPDLNPMDYYVWGRLEAVTNNKEFHSLEALKAAVLKEWDRLDEDECAERACPGRRD